MYLNKLIILCGAPGSGKTTWAKKYCEEHSNTIHVSRDVIRFSLLGNDEYYFAHEDKVLDTFYTLIAQGLKDGKNVIADASHLTRKSRYNCITNIRNKLRTNNFEYPIEVIYFQPPLNVCYTRNDMRTGRAFVPHSAIERMYLSMSDPKYDKSYNYEKIIYIRE